MKRLSTLISIALIAATLIAMGCSSGRPRPRFHSRAERIEFIHQHKLERLPQSDVPLEVNERVIAWMDYFTGPGAKHFRRYLRRSGKYVPMMRQILKEHGLPEDLVYVALIESGFNNTARSHASAVGPWQFIKGTGKRYGLDINIWVDERRDPVKATHAAAKYLKKLHGDFGHWYLAMAGYNAGEGRVSRAIQESGSRNFWVHADPDKKYLKAETRDYVPKYIAATIMAKMPKHFGFGDVEMDKPLEYDTVLIPSQTDIEVVAKCLDVGRVDVEDLNPELKLGATPAGIRNYKLKIPKDSKSKFLVAYAKIPKEDRVKLVTHRVKNGEKLAGVARKYGVSSKSLARANGIGRKSHLRVGTELVIPIGGAYHARVKASGDGGGSRVAYHKVRRGDTVGKIAHKYRVKTADVRRWNNLNKKNMIRVGQKLKIYSGRGPTRVASRDKKSSPVGSGEGGYTVRKGDTPGTIAQKFGIRTQDLVAWNNLNKKRPVVKIGQKLVVSKTAPAPKETAQKITSEALSETPSKTVVASTTHVLKSGQTLGHVAEEYGVGTKDLMRWNNIKNPKRVRAGRKLVVKAPKKKVAANAAPKPETKAVAQPVSEPKTLPKGDMTLAKVTPAEETPSMTAAAPTHKLKPTPMPMPKAQSVTYKIKSGDSLWSIANKHGVKVSDIKKWNRIGKSNKIKPGEKIIIKKM